MNEIKSVDPEELKQWLDNQDVVLIDVREPHEYAQSSIPGSNLIPLGVIENENLPPLEQKKLVLHCGIGKRSYMACEKLLRKNPNLNIYNLKGGITAWKNAGLPTKAASTASSFSIGRQADIFVGVSILIGILLGYFIQPIFFLIPILCGILLLYIGISGSSALAMLLANMPWNKRKH